MKKNIFTRSIALALSAIMVLGLSSCGKKPADKTDSEDSKTVDNSKYVRQLDGFVPEMLSPDFWIDDSEKEILMTPEEIKKFNEDNDKMIGIPGYDSGFALNEFSDPLDGNIVRNVLCDTGVPQDLSREFLGDKNTPEKYWLDLIAAQNIEGIPDSITLRYGFSAERADMRYLPTNDYIAGGDPNDLIYDEMVMTDYLPYKPLVIVHESLDGKWFYAFQYGCGGWIEKENVALCHTREEWLERQNIDEFLVVTGREIRLSDDPHCPALARKLIPMGSKLPLVPADEAPEIINQRSTYGNYIVKLPTVGEDGYIVDEYALIPLCEDVHIGYLDYTSEAAVTLALKLYGDRYGWAGLNFSSDCSGIVNEIFSCFGIILPRTAGTQGSVSGIKRWEFDEECTNEEKLEIIKDLPSGSLVNFSGHIMIYLGMVDGKPYTISATGSIGDGNGGKQSVNSVIINNLIDVVRKNGKSWLESASKVSTLTPGEVVQVKHNEKAAA